MATRRGIAPRAGDVRAPERAAHAGARALTPGETAWLLAVPALALAVACAWLLGPPLGHLFFSGSPYTYWPSARSQLLPKPAQLARFALTVLAALAFAAAIPLAARRAPRLRPRAAR
ncbi:MAG TPA: hypothetical protein VFV85_05180, partial [Conexibacter sp.]|nr:hypothetical protein [Conexibacter sp.]